MADPGALPDIVVEVAYAEAARQFLQRIRLAARSTVADALFACTVGREFQLDLATLDCGIWSKQVPRSTILNDGDRIELYRPLLADPKDARRTRARQKPVLKPSPAQP